MLAALASPCRIKRNPRSWRRRTSGRAVYAYVGGNPITGIDPFGLDTIVIVGNGTLTNPAGHVAIGFTDQGIYSYGTPQPFGSSVSAYITSQESYRNSTAYILKTTPEQEANMITYLSRNYRHAKYDWHTHNCATAVNGALDAGGVGEHSAMDGPSFLPQSAGIRASDVPGETTINLPQGGNVPDSINQFNPGQ